MNKPYTKAALTILNWYFAFYCGSAIGAGVIAHDHGLAFVFLAIAAAFHFAARHLEYRA